MAGVNKVILLGNLGKDPEVRVFEGGRKLVSFPLATKEVYKDKEGNKVENTEWHNVQFWGPASDVIEKYVKKGNQLYVEGKLRTRSYDDKDGLKKYITEIIGDNFTLIGSKPSENQTQNQVSNTNHQDVNGIAVSEPLNPISVPNTEIDDLPF